MDETQAATPDDAAPGRARAGAAPPGLGELAEEIIRQPVGTAISPIVFGGLVRTLEFVVLVCAGLLAQAALVVPREGFEGDYPLALLFGSAVAVIGFQSAGCYTPPALRSLLRNGGPLIGVWAGVFGLLAFALFLLKLGDSFSRAWLLGWFGAGLVALLLYRTGVSRLARFWTANGRLVRRAVIVGGGKEAAELIAALSSSGESDIRICGIFDDRSGDRSPALVRGYPKLGTVGQLVEFARRTRVDLLIVSLPITAERRLLAMLRPLWVLPVDIRLSAHTNNLRLAPRAYTYIGNVPFFDVADRPLAHWNRVKKAFVDYGFGVLILVLALPVMALVALAVRLDSPGPVLFRQKRYGFNNELIEVFKFRSMYFDQCDADAARLVGRGDSRVTRVGAFIRKTSLDELPQLFNVLRGELSLVGPRPHALQAKAANRLYDEVVDGYFARHRVKPGITGWAQINGWRGETDTREKIQQRVAHDLYYIENWSLFLDLYILLMTPFSLMMKREMAY